MCSMCNVHAKHEVQNANSYSTEITVLIQYTDWENNITYWHAKINCDIL